MADNFWYFVMVPMVYLAFAWCSVWIVIRIASTIGARPVPATLRIFPDRLNPDDTATEGPAGGLLGAIRDSFTMPTILRRKPVFWSFLAIFHVALLLLILAHLDLLSNVNIMSPESAHMIGNGAVGLILAICLVHFLFRRFHSPIREVSVPGDFLLLLLLFCIVMSGNVVSWGNSWTENGFVITKQDFGQYLESLVRFQFKDPREFMSGAHYAVIGTHVLLANIFLLVLPFSKIMHVFFAVPMNKMRRG